MSIERPDHLFIPPKPPKPAKPVFLSQPNSPCNLRPATVSCSYTTNSLIEMSSPRLNNQRRSEPIVPYLTTLNNVEPSKPPMRPPKPLKPMNITRLSELTPTSPSVIDKGLKRTTSSPTRRRANYSNFTIGEEDITDVSST